MRPRQEIAPGVDRRRFAEAVRTLEASGLVKPHRLGEGKPTLYTDADAAMILEALKCPDGCPEASGQVSEPQAQRAEKAEASGQVSEGVRTPEAGGALDALKAEIARLEAEAHATRSEAEARARKAEEEGRHSAAAAAALAEKIRDLDEERKNARARISRLERERETPSGILSRIRAALSVLFGQAAVVKALPPGEIIEKPEDTPEALAA